MICLAITRFTYTSKMNKNAAGVCTFDLAEDFVSIRMRSPIFNPKVSMVTCSTAAGEGARDEQLDTEDTVETGDRVPERGSKPMFREIGGCSRTSK